MNAYRLLGLLASLSFISVLSIQHAEGQCRVNEGAKMTAADANSSDEFGRSVSVSGTVAVVGSWQDDDAGSASGSAYVYRLNGGTWVEEQKLTASDPDSGDGFGYSVSISGDVALIGSISDEDAGINSGSAYVYRFDGSTWVEEQKLTPSDADANDWFGISLSISGDVAVVGARFDDDACPENPLCESGSAYVYRFNGRTWVEEQKLTASDATQGDGFGRGVSVSGDVAVVGAYLDDDAGGNSGSAYVYRFDGSAWIEEQKLTASDGAASDLFGISVSVSGDVAVIGAVFDDDAGSWSGSAYVYRFNGSAWVEEQKLTASDAAAGDRYGNSVSISGNVVVVGSHNDDGAGFDSGSAYLYRFDGSTWVEARKLTASDAAPDDRFGYSVAISGGVVVVGSYKDDDPFGEDPTSNSGSVYAFGGNPVLSQPPCGAIDARQPSAPDGSEPAGWGSIAMTFDEPPGPLNAEDFAVVINPPGDAPTVTAVTVDGNTATVHFNDFIATRAWTTITHWPTGAVTRTGYL
ncbi:MAG: FG-GAP repeat protein, partial [Planctomycetes bacterium]|nr:FG-GAP repeat protein [Planctomycetota bacterium]